MATTTIRIAKDHEPGYREVPGYHVGRTMAIHHPPYEDGLPTRKHWSVTHRRTGLYATIREMGRQDATAYAAGFDLILQHYGDDGEWGDGHTITTGERGKALTRYMRLVDQEPNQGLDHNRTFDIPLTRERALQLAEEALKGA
jgi:hypothetical protein